MPFPFETEIADHRYRMLLFRNLSSDILFCLPVIVGGEGR